MKKLLTMGIVAILLFVTGCTKESRDDLVYTYQLLQVSMTVDQVLQLAGTPDVKLPEVIGETWVWRGEHNGRGTHGDISAFISPQLKWTIPETSVTPRLNMNMGRLVYKRWLKHEGGERCPYEL